MQDRGGRQYHITFVDERELPEGVDFAFLEFGGEVWLAYKRTHVTPTVLEDSWAVFRQTLAGAA